MSSSSALTDAMWVEIGLCFSVLIAMGFNILLCFQKLSVMKNINLHFQTLVQESHAVRWRGRRGGECEASDIVNHCVTRGMVHRRGNGKLQLCEHFHTSQ